MMRIIKAFLLLLLILSALFADPVFDHLVWSDEFNSAGYGPVDTSKWFHQTQLPIPGSWYNGEVQHYTNRIDNAIVHSGSLHLIAKKEIFTDQGYTKNYTSARLNSKYAFRYGRIEVRAQLPEGVGTWPAIWLLGTNIDEDGAYWDNLGYDTTPWPACGEIDIMEFLGHDTRTIYGTIHGPGHSGNGAIGNSHSIGQGGFHLGFHVYAIEWESDRITWYIDGFKYHEVKKSEFPAGATWVYDRPFFMLLNVAVGGRWPGSPDETTQFPQTMLVDYVRVFGELP